MRIDYSLHDICFEWDAQKAARNIRKHGVTFENACEEIFRIISARTVTKYERRQYEEQ